jgi:hypothetical protein
MPPLFTKAGIIAGVLGDSLVFSAAHIETALAAKELFSHFDQIWLHIGLPKADSVCSYSITSDGLNLGGGMPEELRTQFERSSAILGLGDGCGLNYVSKTPGIAQLLPV